MSASRSFLVPAVVVITAACPLVHGEKEAPSAELHEDYGKVKELLAAKCHSCHGALKQKAKLVK